MNHDNRASTVAGVAETDRTGRSETLISPIRELASSPSPAKSSSKMKQIERQDRQRPQPLSIEPAIRNRAFATPPRPAPADIVFQRNQLSLGTSATGSRSEAEKHQRMRQRALAFRPIIRSIEKDLWATKKLPFSIQPGANHGNGNATNIKPIGETVSVGEPVPAAGVAPVITVTESSGADRISDLQSAVNTNEDVSVTIGLESTSATQQPVTKMPNPVPTVKELPLVPSSSTSTCSSGQVSTETPKKQNPTPIFGQVVTGTPDGLAASKEKATSETPAVPRTTPPHLRRLPPSQNKRLTSNSATNIGPSEPTAPKPTGKKPGAPSLAPAHPAGPPRGRKPDTSFRIPENPHVDGYNIAAVLKDRNAKVDVKGLKFTAWPQRVNRGDMPIQEARAVIISGFPEAPTLATVSLLCKGAGKLENILLDAARKKALATFINAQDAHDFFTAAHKKSLELMPGCRLFVQMDYPVDMPPFAVQAGNVTRMLNFGGWEKREIAHVVGHRQDDEEAGSLLARLAELYAPGGRVEAVTAQDAGWDYFTGTILFAGIAEAEVALDKLKAEPKFKGCYLSFGRDP